MGFQDDMKESRRNFKEAVNSFSIEPEQKRKFNVGNVVRIKDGYIVPCEGMKKYLGVTSKITSCLENNYYHIATDNSAYVWHEDYLEFATDNNAAAKTDFNEVNNMEQGTIKDSGERTKYSTGAVRDLKEGKGRFDLMPLDVLDVFITQLSEGEKENYKSEDIITYISNFKEYSDTTELYRAMITFANDVYSSTYEASLEVAKHFEQGAKKYGENNWQKGIPVHSYIDSAIRHYVKYKAGWKDESHDRAFLWNLMCCIWTMEHKPELDDFTSQNK